MGPRHRCRGSLAVRDLLGLGFRASMGPRHRCRGSSPRCVQFPKHNYGNVASMGPRHRCRGSGERGVERGGDNVGFNGAATSLSRIVICSTEVAVSNVVLQWGRDIAVADRASLSHTSIVALELQWGRDIAVADRSGLGNVAGLYGQASMGPRHRCRGSRCCFLYNAKNRKCFNGAATSLSRIGSVYG